MLTDWGAKRSCSNHLISRYVATAVALRAVQGADHDSDQVAPESCQPILTAMTIIVVFVQHLSIAEGASRAMPGDNTTITGWTAVPRWRTRLCSIDAAGKDKGHRRH